MPNPASRRECRIAYYLSEAGPATLELFDIRGRRVARVDVGSRGIGDRIVSLGQLIDSGPGLYWARLHQGVRTATARIVVTE